MNTETKAISANFDLLLKSLGAAPAVVVSQQARSNAGTHIQVAAALNSFSQHEQAHETFLMDQSGCFDE